MTRVLNELELTETEAAVLLVHHLTLACAIWEATKQDRGQQVNEIIQRTDLDATWKNAMVSFVDFLWTMTEEVHGDDIAASETPARQG